MTGSLVGSDAAEATVTPAQANTPEVPECTSGCPCRGFARYMEPFPSNYLITNCAGLSARLRDKWGNLRVGTRYEDARNSQGTPIDITFTVDGMRDLARAAGALTDRGTDITSPAPDKPCDILFALWVLHANQYGVRTADKNGQEIERLEPNTHDDFHIVAARLDKDGNVPADVYSTNGDRPLEGPAPMGHWPLNTGSPALRAATNEPQFLEVDTPAEGSEPYTFADLPDSVVTYDTQGRGWFGGREGALYYRYEFYNDMPTTEAFIIDDDFMRSFTTSA